MGQRTIALLYGRVDPDAPQDEKDVLVQLETVRAALQSLGYETMDVPLSLDLGVTRAVLRSARPLAVFNLAETIEGKGSLIHFAPSLLSTLGIPYTGAPIEAILLTSHKILGKRMMQAAGIRTPPFTGAVLAADASPDVEPPWIVKSVWEHASIGMEDSAVVSAQRELSAEIRRRQAAERIDQLFVEQYIDGREINVALLGGRDGPGVPQILPPAEIQFLDYPPGKPRFVGYRAKWDEASFEYGRTPRRFVFPPEDSTLLDTLQQISLHCWNLFGLRGYARVDFRVDARGEPWVLEVNTNPCLSPDAGFLAAAAQAGLSRDEVVRRIVLECDVWSAAAADTVKKESDAWAPR